MMTVKAYNDPAGYRFVVVLDDTMLIPDPSLPTPADGEPDTRPMLQDPAYVREYTWGKDAPEGQTTPEYLQACKREALLLGELELGKLQPPEEIDL